MAGKATVFASPRLDYAMQQLSKNTLIDLMLDRVRAEIGADADDETIAAKVQEWLSPVCNHRGDKPPRLIHRLETWDRYEADHRKRNPNAYL